MHEIDNIFPFNSQISYSGEAQLSQNKIVFYFHKDKLLPNQAMDNVIQKDLHQAVHKALEVKVRPFVGNPKRRCLLS